MLHTKITTGIYEVKEFKIELLFLIANLRVLLHVVKGGEIMALVVKVQALHQVDSRIALQLKLGNQMLLRPRQRLNQAITVMGMNMASLDTELDTELDTVARTRTTRS
ncbi:hypothetical protein V7S43_002114 [Phytophthora oleae]|uniref:Uncharacterized protein n=1 Tax=Phytophthora oleae TaxID=2107226 RepID=A0ABD3G2N5_9STRA